MKQTLFALCVFLCALTMIACGGSGGGGSSPYRGSYSGYMGWDYKPVTATIDDHGSISATVDGQPVTGKIGDRLSLSFVNALFKWDGKTIEDVGVQPYFWLNRL
jgi:hypothetical protein